ncbi:MAG: type II toxin-antitoxin system RelE/ParE family toxin [Fulvivirga sp.]
MVEVRWLTDAKLDLKDIFDYISRDSKRYAQHQIDRIFERTQTLTSQLRAGKVVEEINKPNIRELIEGNYRIIYRIIDEETVDILMVHHGARDLIRRIKP